MGLALPYERITINLSPADLPKEGSHYDLPIALGLLVAMGGLTHDQVAPFVAMGELALDGAHTRGALPQPWRRLKIIGLVCPPPWAEASASQTGPALCRRFIVANREPFARHASYQPARSYP